MAIHLDPLLRLIPDAVPAELRALAQWVGWRARPKPNGKVDKVPCSPHTGAVADAQDPANQGSFAQAVAALRRYHFDGIGIVLTEEDSLVGVDLDGCVDAAGEIAPWAKAIIAELESYTERSPSGRGLRLFAFGGLPPGRRKRGDLELYDAGRFLTVTGHHVAGTPTTVEHRDWELRDFHARHLGRPADAAGSSGHVPEDFDEEEPPVRLDAPGLAAWKGERLVHKENGEVDRSRTLYALACLLARAGATARTIAPALAERDQALGLHKYSDRRDGGELEYRRMAQRAVAELTTATAPVVPPPGGSPALPCGAGCPLVDAEPSARIAFLEAEHRRLRQELTALWERHRAFLAVLQNRALTAAERQVALAVFIAVGAEQSHEEAADGFVRVPLRTVAEQAGCSPQRASVHIGVLEAAGVIEKRTLRRWVEIPDPQTEERTPRLQSEQYLRLVQPPAATLQALTTITPERTANTEEQPKSWGGKRRGCPEHPQAGTITRWTRACLECGRVLDEGERRKGPEEERLIFQLERSAADIGNDAPAGASAGCAGGALDGDDAGADAGGWTQWRGRAEPPMVPRDARSGGGMAADAEQAVRRPQWTRSRNDDD